MYNKENVYKLNASFIIIYIFSMFPNLMTYSETYKIVSTSIVLADLSNIIENRCTLTFQIIMQKHFNDETLRGSLIRVLKVRGNTIYVTIKLRVSNTSRYFIRCQENTC